MLTIPMHAATARPSSQVLVIGRSEKVLREAVDLIRRDGRAAGATNDFAHVLALFDVAALDLVVFGGMVPPDTKETLRTELAAANPAIVFVQGLAGIPGLIAAQVRAAAAPTRAGRPTVGFDGDSRTVTLVLDGPQEIRVVGFWGTAFVPPDPESASAVLFEETVGAGTHTVALAPSFPAVASFIVVEVGGDVHPFAVGPMPRGTTLSGPSSGTPR